MRSNAKFIASLTSILTLNCQFHFKMHSSTHSSLSLFALPFTRLPTYTSLQRSASPFSSSFQNLQLNTKHYPIEMSRLTGVGYRASTEPEHHV